MNRSITLSIGILAVGASVAQATEFRALTQRCEESLALSALPAALRERANVYVWRDGDFEKTISSDGGIHCVVERNHRDAIIPQCITSSGEHSILDGIMERTRLFASGLSADDADAKMREMIDAGDIPGPEAPGVNYMMSDYNLIYTSRTDSVRRFGPHTMFFAPHASNEVVGGSYAMAKETPGFPFVAEAGTHSYIVTFTSKPAETDDVEQNCKGQIDVSPVAVSAN